MKITGNRIIRLNTVGSTNDYLIENFGPGNFREGTIVLAHEQKNGRGLGANTWESEPGLNLTFSIVFYPDFLRPEQQFLLNKVIALSVCEFIGSQLPGKQVSIKWPNDIYVEKGKVAGMLIHNIVKSNTFEASVAGIGININQLIFRSDAPNPVSLSMFTHREHKLDDCLEGLCFIMDRWYLELKKFNKELIDQEYILRLLNFGEFYLYRSKGVEFSGKITGVDEYGRLLMLSVTEKLQVFEMKEIEFIFP